jgi:hypothetical protein
MRPARLAPGLLAAGLLLAAVLPLAAPSGAPAHGGPPLRVGVTRDAGLAAIGRLALVHLREGVGFAVVWQEYADASALRAAVAAGKVDIAVAAPDAADAPPGGDCGPERLEAVRAALRSGWGAEAFLLPLVPGPAACRPPALIVARGVLADLRFGILGKECGRLAAFTTAADVDAVRAAAVSGGERAAVAAARAVLAGKPKR